MNQEELKKRGVIVEGDVYVSDESQIEEGVKLYAPCHILGKSHICKGATILPNTYVVSCYVGENTVVLQSTLFNSHISDNCNIGPFSHIRQHSYVGSGSRIGDFVEIKASRLGRGTKIAHLAYVGDADIGANCNLGCGVVFANYDGKVKHRTYVDDDVFIGSNSNIVAPVHIKKGAYIAAATTVTSDIEADAFCIGRVRASVKSGAAKGRYSRSKKEE